METLALFKKLHANASNCRISDELQMIGLVISHAIHGGEDYPDETMHELRSMHYMLDMVDTQCAASGKHLPNCVKLYLAELGEEAYVNVALRIFLEDIDKPYHRVRELFPHGALRATVAKQLFN